MHKNSGTSQKKISENVQQKIFWKAVYQLCRSSCASTVNETVSSILGYSDIIQNMPILLKIN